jgi:transposase
VETDATRMCELLVGLGDVDVLGVDDAGGDFVEVTVQTRTSRAFCSDCGVARDVEGIPADVLVDLACFGRPARLCWRKRRWRCPEAAASGSWTEVDHAIASPRQRLTRRAGMWACVQVGRHSRTVSEIACELGADWHTVNTAVTAGATPSSTPTPTGSAHPEAIGIDETLAVRRGPFRTQEWLTGIVDVRAGRLLDVVAGRTSAGPIEWFTNQGQAWCSNVKWAALDLSGPYRRVYDIALSQRDTGRRSVQHRQARQPETRSGPPACPDRTARPPGPQNGPALPGPQTVGDRRRASTRGQQTTPPRSPRRW